MSLSDIFNEKGVKSDIKVKLTSKEYSKLAITLIKSIKPAENWIRNLKLIKP